MTVFLQSLKSRVAKALTKPFSVTNGIDDTWSDITTKEFDVNAKAHYTLFQALNDDDISRVIYYKSHSHLVVTHKITSQSQESQNSSLAFPI